ncbi:putative serine/threonine-protein kinase PkwA [Emticicia aquatica]|uniref:Serine/threonine-protein kinase PkwA n=2 Tax=Emticicia aquatica TaxID=1681835 RepID=A0ABN8EVH4_9BACT|nr:putative serine/threonine-protein kinase PkwA [Emticicia aquatica]
MMKVEKIDTFTGHRDCIYALEKTGEKQRFFSAAGDGFVVRWNLQKPDVGELIAKVGHSVYALSYLQEENQLWIAENFEGIHVIDVETKQELRSLKLAPTNYFDIQIYNNQAFVAGGDGVITVIDVDNFSFRKHIKVSSESARCLTINPVEREFAAGFSDNSIKIFDLHTFELKKVIEAHTNSVFALKYSPDFRLLLSGSRDARLKIWNVEQDYSLEKEIVAHTFAINNIAFSPDEKLFATCSMDKSIKIWDAVTFKLLKVIDRARHAGHGTSVNKLLWSDYENQIVSGSDDRTISVWKLS